MAWGTSHTFFSFLDMFRMKDMIYTRTTIISSLQFRDCMSLFIHLWLVMSKWTSPSSTGIAFPAMPSRVRELVQTWWRAAASSSPSTWPARNCVSGCFRYPHRQNPDRSLWQQHAAEHRATIVAAETMWSSTQSPPGAPWTDCCLIKRIRMLPPVGSKQELKELSNLAGPVVSSAWDAPGGDTIWSLI